MYLCLLTPALRTLPCIEGFRHFASLFCILRAGSCIQFAPPHHEKNEHSIGYDQQVPTQKSRRTASPRFFMPLVSILLLPRLK